MLIGKLVMKAHEDMRMLQTYIQIELDKAHSIHRENEKRLEKLEQGQIKLERKE
jgi:hypothetical protein